VQKLVKDEKDSKEGQNRSNEEVNNKCKNGKRRRENLSLQSGEVE
jgi:hypothetical protein